MADGPVYNGPIYGGESPRPRVFHKTVQVAKAGVSFGSTLAIAISWSVHHSIIWAVIQGFFSWLYVLYYAVYR